MFARLNTLKRRVCIVDDEINLQKPLEREEKRWETFEDDVEVETVLSNVYEDRISRNIIQIYIFFYD